MWGVLIFVLGIVAIIVFAINAYQTADQYNRNAIGWAGAVFGIGVLTQFFLPVFLWVFIVILITIGLVTEEGLRWTVFLPLAINLFSNVLSVVLMALILRYLSKVPDERKYELEPPKPDEFRLN